MCHIPQESDDITTEQIEKISKKIQKFGICEVYLQGGEPLLRNDIIKIADIFLEKGIRPTIVTNGEFLTENLYRKSQKESVIYQSV